VLWGFNEIVNGFFMGGILGLTSWRGEILGTMPLGNSGLFICKGSYFVFLNEVFIEGVFLLLLFAFLVDIL
jgi:hypothetical protein